MQQRSFYRLEYSQSCTINLQQIGAASLSQSGNEIIEVQMVDISGGGLCFISDRDLPMSKALTWKMVFSLREKPFKVLGHLIWRQPHNEDAWRYGVEFLIIDPNLQNELIASINALQLRT